MTKVFFAVLASGCVENPCKTEADKNASCPLITKQLSEHSFMVRQTCNIEQAVKKWQLRWSLTDKRRASIVISDDCVEGEEFEALLKSQSYKDRVYRTKNRDGQIRENERPLRAPHGYTPANFVQLVSTADPKIFGWNHYGVSTTGSPITYREGDGHRSAFKVRPLIIEQQIALATTGNEGFLDIWWLFVRK